MYLYRTYFKLTACVNDFEAAKQYLIEDDMVKYLQGDRRCSDSTYNKIKKISWILTDEMSGHIDLETIEALSKEELSNISDWVSGQNSDGLGEGFEQQDFAFYNDSYGEDEDEYEQNYVMASFDWKSNKYLFELVKD